MKCSGVGGVLRWVMCPKGIDQKLYLKCPLTARPIAKVNVLACTNFVLIVANNMFVSIVCTDVLNKLFQIKHCEFVVFPDGFTLVPVARSSV